MPEKQYEAITGKVRESVERERHPSGNSNFPARSQLTIAATQESYETEQLHYQGQSLESSMEPVTNQLLTDARSYAQACQAIATAPNPNNPHPSKKDAEIAACDRLRGGIEQFRLKYDSFEGEMNSLGTDIRAGKQRAASTPPGRAEDGIARGTTRDGMVRDATKDNFRVAGDTFLAARGWKSAGKGRAPVTATAPRRQGSRSDHWGPNPGVGTHQASLSGPLLPIPLLSQPQPRRGLGFRRLRWSSAIRN